MNKKFFLISVISTLFFTHLFCDDSLEKVSLQLKWKYQFQFAGFLVAKEKGFYLDAGLDVDIKEYDNQTYKIEDILDEKITFGVSDSALISESIKGSPVVGMMPIYQTSPYILLSLKSSNIKNLEDLHNKKIVMYDDINGLAIKSVLKLHNINFIQKRIKDKFTALKNGEVDAIIAYISNEPFLAKQMGIKTNIIRPDVYGFERYGDILFTSQSMAKNRPNLVNRMNKATKRGFEYAFTNIDEAVDIIYNKYNTQNKTKEALRYEANALKKMAGYDENFAMFDKEKIKNIAYIYSFTELKKQNFKRQNLKNLEHFVFNPGNLDIKIKFSQKEKEYLQKIKKIKVCFARENAPYSMVQDSKAIGIGADFLNILENKIDIEFEYIYSRTFKEQLFMAKNGKCDIVPLILNYPQTIPFLEATKPIGRDNMVLVTKINEPYVFDIAKLKNKKIGIDKNTVNVVKYLREKFPEIEIVESDGLELEKLVDGELYGFIDTSIRLNYWISSKYNDKLKVMRTFEDSVVEGSMGVHISEPILLSILNKTIFSMSDFSKDEIYNKWIDINYKTIIDYRPIYEVIFLFLFVLIIVVYWNRKLQKEVFERKLAEKKLKESEEKFRTLFDISPILIDAFDENGRCILWNRECERVFGWSIEELNEHENILGLFYTDISVQERVLESFSSEINNVFNEWEPLTKTGEIVYVMWANVLLPNGETINVGYDITKQKKSEQQLQETKNKLDIFNKELQVLVEKELQKSRQKDIVLQQQSKMASMGEMVENIAHQWRQPLSQINSAVLMIDTNLDINNLHNTKVEEKLQEIESLTDYMSKTINAFQNFFNPKKQKKSFSLVQMIEDALFILKGSLDENMIQVRVKADSSFIYSGYQEELQQVMIVILNNAKDVLISRKSLNPKIDISLNEMQKSYELKVCDNGGGIDEDIIAKVFEPYFTTKHKAQGTGLGLYMSKMIIENALEGELLAENSQDGACFKIILKKVQ